MSELISTITSDEYKKTKDFLIIHGVSETKFGKVLLGLNEDRVCYISFYEGETPSLADMKKVYPNAQLEENNDKIKSYAQDIFDKENHDIKVLLKGTPFETSVWKQLINLKKGATFSYEDVAKALGNPKAIRAVAKAVTKNNISYLIPCHRVISKSGGLSKYKWGAERKVKMLKHENAI